MKKNLADWDRILRVLGGLAMMGAAGWAPWPLWARLALGGNGVYLLLSALYGACLGYRLMGRSTCPLAEKRG